MFMKFMLDHGQPSLSTTIFVECFLPSLNQARTSPGTFLPGVLIHRGFVGRRTGEEFQKLPFQEVSSSPQLRVQVKTSFLSSPDSN